MTDAERMLELLTRRQSDRKYTGEKVSRETAERILEAGRVSPSACNSQPWKFIASDDPETIGKLAKAASAGLIGMNTFVAQAPLIITIVREKPNFTSKIGGTIKNKDYSLIDIGIAAQSICIQAEAEGLGSCMIGWFDEEAVRKILSIPRGKRIELMITIGHSASQQRDKSRRKAEEIISWNRY